MKNFLTILMLCGVCCGYAQNTPRYAASTKIWTIGNQTWSDAIHIPECDKETFENSNTDPQCRSYSSGSRTYYYYNWPYVDANEAKLCPSPWRVPSRSDFEVLEDRKEGATITSYWGQSGSYAYGRSIGSDRAGANLWSSTKAFSGNAYRLNYTNKHAYVAVDIQSYGFRVRCVR